MPRNKILPIHYNKIKRKPRRNDAFFDKWSIVHLISGISIGWVMDPFLGLAILVLWEPLEIFILSPILARYGIVFGYESLRNSLSDVLFDVIGVALGYYLLANIVDPPFTLLQGI